MMTQAQITEQNELNSKLAHNYELTHRENMILLYSDFHKDAYGFRPRTINVYALTTEELEADFDRFEATCKINRHEEEMAEMEAVNRFKDLITNTIAIGAGDEATALRWIVEGAYDDFGFDYEHFLWNQGIAYSDYGKAMAKVIAPIFGQVYASRRAA
jgi:hypothetical protein